MERILVALFSALAVAITGCPGPEPRPTVTDGGPQSGPFDAVVPTVATVRPEAGSILADDGAIEIRFSETMDRRTLVLSGNLALESNGGTWSTTTSVDDTLRVAPASFWTVGPRRSLVVNAQDLAGNALAELSIEYDEPNKLVFVTSVSGIGNLGLWADAGGETGLRAADAICQARANAAHLRGTFVAWLSDSVDDAYCRLHGLRGKKAENCGQAVLPPSAGPWVRTDRFPFSGTAEFLATRGAYAPPILDEFGALVIDPHDAVGAKILTNTRIDGTAASHTATCADWTVVGTQVIRVGTTSSTFYWSDGPTAYCSETEHLACFETGPGSPLPPFVREGKKVFATSTTGNGNLSTWSDAQGATGIAAGDAICRARATAGGLANPARYKAWLSDSHVAARDRITSAGPWVRLDGVVLAENRADLLDGALFTAIVLDEFGMPDDAWVLTGTKSDGQAGNSCADWTSSSASDLVLFGRRDYISGRWTEQNEYLCNYAGYDLYCFED